MTTNETKANVTVNETLSGYTKIKITALLDIETEKEIEVYLKPIFIKNKKKLTFISKDGNIFYFPGKVYDEKEKPYTECVLRVQKTGENFSFFVKETKNKKLIRRLKNLISYNKPDLNEFIQLYDENLNKKDKLKIKSIIEDGNSKYCFKLDDGIKLRFINMLTKGDFITCYIYGKDFQTAYITKGDAEKLVRMRNDYLISVIK